MPTLNEMTDNVRTKLTIDPTKDIWSDSELKTYLNEGLTRFYAKADMKESWEDGTINPLVDGQGNYAKPADMRRLFWAAAVYTGATSTDADETPLTIITDILGDFQQNHDMDYEGDQPEYIYEEGGELWLYPVPNSDAVSDYTVKYKYGERPATLGGTDSPAFPAEWHFIIEDYAVWRAWKKLPEKADETAAAKDAWEEGWRQAIQDILWSEGERLTWRPPVLPSKRKK
jgi:hypothetical protein